MQSVETRERNAPYKVGWSEEEEFLIAKIQETESVARAEAIKRMDHYRGGQACWLCA
jgi:hypothetical protein